MDSPSDDCSVKVAVKIRPLVSIELEQGCRTSLTVPAPGVPQVHTGHHCFTYDQVYGEGGRPDSLLYQSCVSPLIEGLFKGYNATVFAYGQTGSGKSHTMGSEYRPGSKAHGVIPEAISAIFDRISTSNDYECSVRVSFVEIHKEEIRDLLSQGSGSGPRPSVTIRENVQGGGISLYGAVEKDVKSVEEMAGVLETGTLCRSTASTNMNRSSSRSHAIFTITVEQRRIAALPINDGADEEMDDESSIAAVGDDYLCAKMHLVDLAGSERAKRTKAEGARLKEGIHINRGLLALGNVINAIVDGAKHVPYRDSKLTRLLQDSLGGNSRTVMIACVSPADVNYEETLNTLRYADRARHIRNKPVINRDPMTAQVAALRQLVARLQAENVSLKQNQSNGGAPSSSGGDSKSNEQWIAIAEQLQQETVGLELENAQLKVQVESLTADLSEMNGKYFNVKADLDMLSIRQGGGGGGGGGLGVVEEDDGLTGLDQDLGDSSELGGGKKTAKDLVQGYLARIAELEKEVRGLRSHSHSHSHTFGVNKGRSTLSGAGVRASAGGGGGGGGSGGVNRTSSLQPHLPALNGASGSNPGSVCGDDDEIDPDQDLHDEDVHEMQESAEEQRFFVQVAAHAMEQEKMQRDMSVLQKLLESKERRMQDLVKSTGQHPLSQGQAGGGVGGGGGMKQHYERVLQDLEKERDVLQSEKAAIMQKMQALHSSSEEEKKRLEAFYKEKISQYDEKLKEVRRKEREFLMMSKLKQRSDELCSRLNGDISRIKQQKVSLQKSMEVSARQFSQWKADREKELVKLRRVNRRNVAHIQQLQALQAKQNAVLQRKMQDANLARRKLKEIQSGSNRRESHGGGGFMVEQRLSGGGPSTLMPPPPLPHLSSHSSSHIVLEVRASGSSSGGGGGGAGGGLVSSKGFKSERERREWIEKELEACNQSQIYQKILDGELAQRAQVAMKLKDLEKKLLIAQDLVPSSPMVHPESTLMTPPPTNGGGGGGGVTVMMMMMTQQGGVKGGKGGDLARIKAKREVLQRQLEGHNAQISDLQSAWDQAKLEEEGRGGGAVDASRWANVQSLMEARDLLKSVFMTAGDYKSQANEAQLELLRSKEEGGLIKVQLDAARKESEAARRRAASLEAGAAAAIAIATSSAASTPFEGRLDLVAAADGAGGGGGGGGGAGEGSTDLRGGGGGMVFMGVNKRLSVVDKVDRAVDKLIHKINEASTPIRGSAPTIGTEPLRPEDMQLNGRYELGSSDDDDDEEEEDYYSVESDDDDSIADENWNPTKITPGFGGGGGSGGRVRGGGGGGGGGGYRSGPSSRPPPRKKRSLGDRRSEETDLPPHQPSRTTSTIELEVLSFLQQEAERKGEGVVDKVTVKGLKNVLQGQMVEGRMWRPGSKNREQLLMDAHSLAVKQRLQRREEGERDDQVDHPPSPMSISPLPLHPTREAVTAPQEEEAPLLKTGTSPTLNDSSRRSGGGGGGGGGLTPLSLLYIEKAKEARERTAQLRQSIQKKSTLPLPLPSPLSTSIDLSSGLRRSRAFLSVPDEEEGMHMVGVSPAASGGGFDLYPNLNPYTQAQGLVANESKDVTSFNQSQDQDENKGVMVGGKSLTSMMRLV